MCGIVGHFNLAIKKPLSSDELGQMYRAIAHRGPDAEGAYRHGPISLGFARLAIIDLSPLGHQPMSTDHCSACPPGLRIVFNGEIYNFTALRAELESQGHVFKSNSDTETIIHGYANRGVEILNDLRGMFAFALWDPTRRRLFGARDRLGKKPFFYRFQPGKEFRFASELRALLVGHLPRTVDPVALHHYLGLQYIPAPWSAFKEIKKLPAGHSFILEQGKLSIRRYWQLDFSQKDQRSEAEWGELIRDQLREAIKLRLVSDVPLGAFLSGGVDSSAIVAFMSELQNQPIKTFSIGFDEATHNELPFAKIIADRFKTDHHEFIIRPDAIKILPALVWHYGEPYADSSALPTFQVAQMTRQYVTVALNGDGGDENFAGYDRYQAVRIAERLNRIPRWLRDQAVPVGLRLFAQAFPTTWTNRLERFARTLSKPLERRYLQYIGYFKNDEKDILYTPAFREQMITHNTENWLAERFYESGTPDRLDQTLYTDITSYLPDDLLVKVDIATMAHSLEGRSPLLDHKFMEMTARIPSNLKLRGSTKKYIFKSALRGILPTEILDRPKMGFGLPIDNWFRNELKPLAYAILLDQKTLSRGYFSRAGIEYFLNRHTQTSVNYGYRIWALIFLELWHRIYADPGQPSLDRVPSLPLEFVATKSSEVF